MDVVNLAVNNRRAKQARNDQVYQARVDNRFRNKQFIENTRRYDLDNYREDNRLRRIKKDAAAAGISTMAAMGLGGTTPSNIQMPVGQGGRVSGTYQRQSPVEARISMDMSRNSHNQALLIQAEADKATYEAWDMRNQYNLKWDHQTGLPRQQVETIDPLYQRYLWNIEQARQWDADGYAVLPDPQAGIELPETVGFGYWSAPRVGAGEPSMLGAP